MRNSVRGITSGIFTLLFGATSAQNMYDGPFVGSDGDHRLIHRKSDWYCDLTRIVGCARLNHICYVQLIFGDESCDPLVAQSQRCPTQTEAEECWDHDVEH